MNDSNGLAPCIGVCSVSWGAEDVHTELDTLPEHWGIKILIGEPKEEVQKKMVNHSHLKCVK